jgi:hypothetical protein
MGDHMAENDGQPLPTPILPTPPLDRYRRIHGVGVHSGRRTDVEGPQGRTRRDGIATGTADIFAASKDAALFEASALSTTEMTVPCRRSSARIGRGNDPHGIAGKV